MHVNVLSLCCCLKWSKTLYYDCCDYLQYIVITVIMPYIVDIIFWYSITIVCALYQGAVSQSFCTVDFQLRSPCHNVEI